MTAKKIVLLLTIAFSMFAYSTKLLAQCKTVRQCFLQSCDVLPPATECSNPGGVPNGLVCSWSTYRCIPTKPIFCLTCMLSSPAPAQATQPINLANGNTYITQTDVAVPGLGGALSLVRTWNSLAPSSGTPGIFGLNWRSNFEERITTGSDGLFEYARGNGDVWTFGFRDFGEDSSTFYYSLAGPSNGDESLKLGGSTWTITYKSGEARTFDMATGSLRTIVDRNGNTTQLSYDGANRVVTVTDAAGRHLYFTYASGSSYLVTGVSSDFGISLSYSYDGSGRLTGVTKPDSTTLSFEYNSQSLITAVKDSDNKVLESHTYDSQKRGLTSSRANGVEAVTVSYPKPEPPTP